MLKALSAKGATWRTVAPLHISVMVRATKVDVIPVEGLPYKIMEPRPPVIEFAPQRLLYDDGKLNLHIYNQDDAATFGIEISIERPANPARYKNAELFQEICRRLRERSRPCIFAAGKKLIRTRIYVSTNFGAEINQHAYLRKGGLKLMLS